MWTIRGVCASIHLFTSKQRLGRIRFTSNETEYDQFNHQLPAFIMKATWENVKLELAKKPPSQKRQQ